VVRCRGSIVTRFEAAKQFNEKGDRDDNQDRQPVRGINPPQPSVKETACGLLVPKSVLSRGGDAVTRQDEEHRDTEVAQLQHRVQLRTGGPERVGELEVETEHPKGSYPTKRFKQRVAHRRVPFSCKTMPGALRRRT